MTDAVQVARVRDALDGVPDDTTLYARGMKLTGWRHEVTAGEVRTLLAALEKYGRHDADCPALMYPGNKCTCGLTAALAASTGGTRP